MLLGDNLGVCSLEGGDNLSVFFGTSGGMGSSADNIPGCTLVDSKGRVLGMTDGCP